MFASVTARVIAVLMIVLGGVGAATLGIGLSRDPNIGQLGWAVAGGAFLNVLIVAVVLLLLADIRDGVAG